ncbi:MAG: hypothetical protein ABMA64_42255 [Myxococcota bacterium]
MWNAVWLGFGGCFLITDAEIRQHDRKIDAGDADTDVDADTDTDTDLDPDGTPETATEVTDDLGRQPTCVPGAIDPAGDVDWYRFSGAAPDQIQLVSTVAASASPPSIADTVLASADGPQSDDSLFGVLGSDSVLTSVPDRPVRVSDATDGGPGHTYEVCAQIIDDLEFEPNDNGASTLHDLAGTKDPLLIGGQWTGDPDTFQFFTRADRVYRAALVPGHQIPNARLVRLDPYTSLPVQTSTDPTYDGAAWAQGYPADAALLFTEATGVTTIGLAGGNGASGPYVLALDEVGPFVADTEPNNNEVEPQAVPLLLQPDGVYLSMVAGWLSYNDATDVFRITPPQGGKLDLVVQSASVGTELDAALWVLDGDTYEEIAYVDSDPGGLLGTDPAVAGADLAGHDSVFVEVLYVDDPYPSDEPYFLTVRVRP